MKKRIIFTILTFALLVSCKKEEIIKQSIPITVNNLVGTYELIDRVIDVYFDNGTSQHTNNHFSPTNQRIIFSKVVTNGVEESNKVKVIHECRNPNTGLWELLNPSYPYEIWILNGNILYNEIFPDPQRSCEITESGLILTVNTSWTDNSPGHSTQIETFNKE